MAQVYTDGQGFIHVNPRISKSLAGITLDNLNENIGITNTIIYDRYPEQVSTNSYFQTTTRKCKIREHQCKPYYQWQNIAGNFIWELERIWKRHMIKCRAPKHVWDFGMVYKSDILSIISPGHEDKTCMERIT